MAVKKSIMKGTREGGRPSYYVQMAHNDILFNNPLFPSYSEVGEIVSKGPLQKDPLINYSFNLVTLRDGSMYQVYIADGSAKPVL
jgi:hypothetical protein